MFISNSLQHKGKHLRLYLCTVDPKAFAVLSSSMCLRLSTARTQ